MPIVEKPKLLLRELPDEVVVKVTQSSRLELGDDGELTTSLERLIHEALTLKIELDELKEEGHDLAMSEVYSMIFYLILSIIFVKVLLPDISSSFVWFSFLVGTLTTASYMLKATIQINREEQTSHSAKPYISNGTKLCKVSDETKEKKSKLRRAVRDLQIELLRSGATQLPPELVVPKFDYSLKNVLALTEEEISDEKAKREG